MAVATTPNARIFRAGIGAPASFSATRRRRIDVDREAFTILAYLAGGTVGGGGFQFTADADRRLIIYRANAFVDFLGGAGPIIPIGEWWDFAITTITDDVPNNVRLFYGPRGGTITQLVVSYPGAYQYQRHGANERPGNDGQDGAFRLHGSLADDRDWYGQTLTPTQILAELDSPEPIIAPSAWWLMESAATVTADSSGNGLTLTSTPGTGTVTDTDGPSFGDDTNDAAVAAVTPAATGALTADARSDAALTASAPAATAAAAGDAQTDAVVAAAVPAATAAVTGTAATDGTAAATAPPATGALSGDAVSAGAVSAASPVPSALLVGAAATAGVLTAAAPAATAEFAEDESTVGVLVAVAPTVTGSLTGAASATGSLSATAPAATARFSEETGRAPQVNTGGGWGTGALVRLPDLTPLTVLVNTAGEWT